MDNSGDDVCSYNAKTSCSLAAAWPRAAAVSAPLDSSALQKNGLTAHLTVGVTVRFLVNISFAYWMQRHVAAFESLLARNHRNNESEVPFFEGTSDSLLVRQQGLEPRTDRL